MAGIHRRNFLKMGAAVTTAVAANPSLVQAMELQLGGSDYHQIRTFHPRLRKPLLCTMCPFFDGGYSYSEAGQVMKTEGNPDHYATRGKFCTKGLSSLFSVTDPDRILAPMKRVGPRGSGQWKEITWEEAIAQVSEKISANLDNPDSIHLNEGGFKDGATLRFMDTIGSKSVVRSRIPSIGCAAKQTALKEVMGVNYAIPDLEHAKYVLNFGANIMETAFPLAQRLTDGIVNNRLKLVTFDVRMSNTAGRSDEWVPVFPGSDGIIALAMANLILQKGLADTEFIDNWTNQSSESLTELLAPYTMEKAAQASGVAAKTLESITLEFAKWKPGAIFSLNGATWHENGLETESAILLLAAISGNVEVEGGLCLPRQFDMANVTPAPDPAGSEADRMRYNYTFPFEVKEGKQKVSVLFNHMSNPAYSSPAASIWREVLKDEALVPFVVDFSPFMSETAELADLILPDVVNVERHDAASSPTSLKQWASMTVPAFKARGQAQDVRETLKAIVKSIDADGSREMAQYWAFKNAKDWVKKEIYKTDGLGKKAYKKMRKSGVWPILGKLDPANRQITKGGKAVKGEYGLHKASGFPTPSGKMELRNPSWSPNPKHKDLGEGQFVLTTYKVAYHTLSMTSNLKLLSELWHSNPLWINKQTAKALGIGDGELVRVTSDVGYLVTRAWATQGIHPKVVGISTSVGRTAYGRVAKADSTAHEPFADPGQQDLDIDDNLWWRDGGVNPNDIIPLAIDPESGVQAWNDTVVAVAPAKPGDQYGEIKVDNEKHVAIYKKRLG
ncbi:MAG: molybdopterin-dependent oxidoreductase [Magnetococcales bacterium]|nr:molybdopterin-dependent oxidoreductase [Magnetococcales bacterium]